MLTGGNMDLQMRVLNLSSTVSSLDFTHSTSTVTYDGSSDQNVD